MTGFAVGIHFGQDAAAETIDPAVVAAAVDAFKPWPRPAILVGPSSVLLTTDDVVRALGAPGPGSALLSTSWLVADARLDDADNLAAGLTGPRIRETATSSRSARHATLMAAVWDQRGEVGLESLDGDFACVVWEARERRLLAARDVFGVRPLYFVEGEGSVWVSNLPAALLAVAARLDVGLDFDELGVLDTLLFDRCLEPGGTVYRALRRVPPGGFRWWRDGQTGEKTPRRLRGFPLQLEADLDERQVAERVTAVLDASTRDRLPTDRRASVLMSGGLDSTAVAASAVAAGGGLIAHTVEYQSLIPDREGEYAALAAAHLGIEHRRHAVDGYRLFERWDELAPTPLPAEPAVDAMYVDIDRAALQHSSVLLTGFGADPLLLPDRFWLWRQVAAGRPLRGLAAWLRAFRAVGVRPPLGLASMLARRGGAATEWRRAVPDWLSPDFAARVGAEERWRALAAPFESEAFEGDAKVKRDRRAALKHTLDPGWSHLFERLDAGARGVPLVRRHPFFDRRVVETLLSLESLPWCLDKWALRVASRSRLPASIWRRPKTPLAGEPWPGSIEPLGRLWPTFAGAATELGAFLDGDAIGRQLRQGGDQESWTILAPALSLACWSARRVWR